jgi:hypothetical protein
MKISDRPRDKYDKIAANYKQLRRKIKPWRDDLYIDNTNNKQLFKEMRGMMIDVLQLFKHSQGIQRDDDTDI